MESSVGSEVHLEDSPTSSADRDGDGVVSEVRQRSLDVDKLKLFTNEGKSGGVESTPRLKTQEDRSGGSVRSGVSDVTIKDELDSDVANPGKISSDELLKWTVVPLRSDGSVDLPSIKGTPTAFAVKLDVMPKSSSLNVDWIMKTSGNHPSDLYVNQWSDLNNSRR